MHLSNRSTLLSLSSICFYSSSSIDSTRVSQPFIKTLKQVYNFIRFHCSYTTTEEKMSPIPSIPDNEKVNQGTPEIDQKVKVKEGACIEKLEWRVPTADFQTLVITETTCPERFSSRPVAVPIVTSSTFEKNNAESVLIEEGKSGTSQTEYMYGRYANPTRDVLEHALAKLEGVKHGVTFGSGTAAICGVLDCLNVGDGIVSMLNIYGGAYHLLKRLHANNGIDVQFLTEFTVETVTRAIRENTKMIWMESPTNPTIGIVDVEQISRAVHGLNKNIVVVIDNTFLTPVFQRPIELGADICVYSLSKYLGGHGDVIMGAVTTDSDELHKKIRANQLERGGVPSPFDCYLAIRSLKTLPIRLAIHYEVSMKVAQFLESHPLVEKVLHPGLKSHKDHKLALKQQFGHSGIMGFYIRGGLQESEAFLAAVKIVKNAASLGGDGSLVSIPAQISHKALTEEDRQTLGITDNYIRLSIGLESAQALIEDLDQALKIACGKP